MHKKGYEYEKFVRTHMTSCLNRPVYLWKDVPTPLLINLGIIDSHNAHRLKRKEQKENPLINTGIDIVADQTIVQCKNGYSKGITQLIWQDFQYGLLLLVIIRSNECNLLYSVVYGIRYDLIMILYYFSEIYQ